MKFLFEENLILAILLSEGEFLIIEPPIKIAQKNHDCFCNYFCRRAIHYCNKTF